MRWPLWAPVFSQSLNFSPPPCSRNYTMMCFFFTLDLYTHWLPTLEHPRTPPFICAPTSDPLFSSPSLTAPFHRAALDPWTFPIGAHLTLYGNYLSVFAHFSPSSSICFIISFSSLQILVWGCPSISVGKKLQEVAWVAANGAILNWTSDSFVITLNRLSLGLSFGQLVVNKTSQSGPAMSCGMTAGSGMGLRHSIPRMYIYYIGLQKNTHEELIRYCLSPSSWWRWHWESGPPGFALCSLRLSLGSWHQSNGGQKPAGESSGS